MSVLASKRNLSSIQYVQSFLDLNDSFRKILDHVPKRRQPYICRPIRRILSRIYSMIVEVSDKYFSFGIKLKNEQEQAQTIIGELLSLQKPLLVLWCIEGYKESKMRMMANSINQEIFYVARMGGITEERRIFVARWHDVEFLDNMVKLVKTIHSKVIHLPYGYKESTGYDLVDLANEGLTELLGGMKIICSKLGLQFSEKKTRIAHVNEGFTFLKVRYLVLPSGKVVRKLSRKGVVRMRRRLKKLKRMVDNGILATSDAFASYQSWDAHSRCADSFRTRNEMRTLYNTLFFKE